MRRILPELEVATTTAKLPADGETARVELGRSGPRERGNHVDLPAFETDPRRHRDLPNHLRRRIDRFSALAYLAISEVLGAIPEAQRTDADRTGVFLTNTRAGWSYGEPELGLLVDEGPQSMHAYQATAWFPAAAQGEVTIALGLKGCAKTTAGHQSGFGEALWLARDSLERGDLDLAVVGAVESLVNGFVLRDWSGSEALPSAGVAEGAVVFALRRPLMDDSPRLRDLRCVPEFGSAAKDWVPTLSAAGRLHTAISNAVPGAERTLSLGGGYQITAANPDNSTWKESA